MISDIIKDSAKRAPTEACGFLLDTEYLPLDNISSKPAETFLIDPKMYLRLKSRIIAIVHSHPCGDAPSMQDKYSCNAGTIPWVIYAIDKFYILYPEEYLDNSKVETLHYLLEREGFTYDNLESAWTLSP